MNDQNENGPAPVLPTRTAPPANFDMGRVRIGPSRITQKLKVDYLRLRLLSELTAISIACKGYPMTCFAEIEVRIKSLSDEEIWEGAIEAERRL